MVSSVITSTDDEGVTWTVRYTDDDAAVPIDLVGAAYSNVVYGLRDSSLGGPVLLRSGDGSTWQEFDLPNEAEGVAPSGIAYDIVTDSLFLAFTDSQEVWKLKGASQSSPSQANWTRVKSLNAAPKGYRGLVVCKLVRPDA